jgi:hypothetical protein
MHDPAQTTSKPAGWRRTRYGIAFTLGLAVAAMGYITSFDNLMTYAKKHGFLVAPALPIGLDLGIPALLLLDSLRPSAYLRWSAWGLTAFTVFANAAVTPGGGITSAVLHAVMPAVAVVFFETARHLREDPSRMDRIRFARYAVSPVRTVRLRVRMIRWEVTSYADALRLESAILLARAVLVSEYHQRVWRRTEKLVPVILRHQLDTGQVPHQLFFETDWPAAVRSWVREVLDDLDPHRGTGLLEPERSEPDSILVSDAGAPDPWDLIWDQRDRLVPQGVSGEAFIQAIAIARNHYEQVNRHIGGEKLRGPIFIAKARANTIARVLKTAYESGIDQAVALLDPSPTADDAPEWQAETDPDPDGPAGLTEDVPAPAGGAS